MSAPVLQTQRLVLTPVAASDYEDLSALWHDGGFTRFISGRPLTREEVWTRLLRDIGHWQVMGFGNWAIRLKDSGEYAGSVGIFDYRRDMIPPFPVPEVGWGLASHFHGLGLGQEALQAVLFWADRHLETQRTMCMIAPENHPSVKLAIKHGYSPQGTAEYHGSTVDLYSRLRGTIS